MKAKLIDDWSELETLEPEWNELLRSARSNTIFLTWEWLRAWLDVTERRHEPLIASVRDARGRLCGIAPFYVAPYRVAGIVPLRVLRVVGDVATGAEYPDWIVRRNHEATVERLLVETLRSSARAWHGLWLPNLASWNGADRHLARAFSSLGCYARSRRVPFSRLELPHSLEEYERRLSRGRREQIRRKRRKLLRGGDVTITRCEAPDELDAYLEALFDLHGRRWRLRGEEGSFRRRPQLKRFYRRFAPTAMRNGWLRLFALKQADTFRAVQLGYVYGNVFYQIQEGFDPEFSPGAGNVLRHEIIRTCIDEGLDAYDFMAGESEHKRRWGAQTRSGYDLFIGRPSVRIRPLFAAGVWPTGRYLKPAACADRPTAQGLPAGRVTT